MFHKATRQWSPQPCARSLLNPTGTLPVSNSRVVVKALEGRWPKAATVLLEAEEDVLAYMAFPQEHWARIYSTNPLERLNREVKRRTDIVGVFPDQESVLRLVGSVLLEIDDEWHVERRYFSQDSMRKLHEPSSDTPASAGPLRLGPIR